MGHVADCFSNNFSSRGQGQSDVKECVTLDYDNINLLNLDGSFTNLLENFDLSAPLVAEHDEAVDKISISSSSDAGELFKSVLLELDPYQKSSADDNGDNSYKETKIKLKLPKLSNTSNTIICDKELSPKSPDKHRKKHKKGLKSKIRLKIRKPEAIKCEYSSSKLSIDATNVKVEKNMDNSVLGKRQPIPKLLIRLGAVESFASFAPSIAEKVKLKRRRTGVSDSDSTDATDEKCHISKRKKRTVKPSKSDCLSRGSYNDISSPENDELTPSPVSSPNGLIELSPKHLARAVRNIKKESVSELECNDFLDDNYSTTEKVKLKKRGQDKLSNRALHESFLLADKKMELVRKRKRNVGLNHPIPERMKHHSAQNTPHASKRRSCDSISDSNSKFSSEAYSRSYSISENVKLKRLRQTDDTNCNSVSARSGVGNVYMSSSGNNQSSAFESKKYSPQKYFLDEDQRFVERALKRDSIDETFEAIMPLRNLFHNMSYNMESRLDHLTLSPENDDIGANCEITSEREPLNSRNINTSERTFPCVINGSKTDITDAQATNLIKFEYTKDSTEGLNENLLKSSIVKFPEVNNSTDIPLNLNKDIDYFKILENDSDLIKSKINNKQMSESDINVRNSNAHYVLPAINDGVIKVEKIDSPKDDASDPLFEDHAKIFFRKSKENTSTTKLFNVKWSSGISLAEHIPTQIMTSKNSMPLSGINVRVNNQISSTGTGLIVNSSTPMWTYATPQKIKLKASQSHQVLMDIQSGLHSESHLKPKKAMLPIHPLDPSRTKRRIIESFATNVNHTRPVMAAGNDENIKPCDIKNVLVTYPIKVKESSQVEVDARFSTSKENVTPFFTMTHIKKELDHVENATKTAMTKDNIATVSKTSLVKNGTIEINNSVKSPIIVGLDGVFSVAKIKKEPSQANYDRKHAITVDNIPIIPAAKIKQESNHIDYGIESIISADNIQKYPTSEIQEKCEQIDSGIESVIAANNTAMVSFTNFDKKSVIKDCISPISTAHDASGVSTTIIKSEVMVDDVNSFKIQYPKLNDISHLGENDLNLDFLDSLMDKLSHSVLSTEMNTTEPMAKNCLDDNSLFDIATQETDPEFLSLFDDRKDIPLLQPAVKAVSSLQSTIKDVSSVQPNMKNVSSIQPIMKNVSSIQPNIKNVSSIQPNMKNVSSIQPNMKNVSSIQPNMKNVSSIDPAIRVLSPMQMTTKVVTSLKPAINAVSSVKPTIRAISRLQPKTHTPHLSGAALKVSSSLKTTTCVQPIIKTVFSVQPTVEDVVPPVQQTSKAVSSRLQTSKTASSGQPQVKVVSSAISTIKKASSLKPTTRALSSMMPISKAASSLEATAKVGDLGDSKSLVVSSPIPMKVEPSYEDMNLYLDINVASYEEVVGGCVSPVKETAVVDTLPSHFSHKEKVPKKHIPRLPKEECKKIVTKEVIQTKLPLKEKGSALVKTSPGVSIPKKLNNLKSFGSNMISMPVVSKIDLKNGMENSKLLSSSKDNVNICKTQQRPQSAQSKEQLNTSPVLPVTKRQWTRWSDPIHDNQRHNQYHGRSDQHLDKMTFRGENVFVKAIEERRVIHIDNLPEAYSVEEIQERFSRFGEIEDITIKSKECDVYCGRNGVIDSSYYDSELFRGCNNLVKSEYGQVGKKDKIFAFVTFKYSKSAIVSLERGNENPSWPRLSINFGGRRAYVGKVWTDFDGRNEEMESKALFRRFPVANEEDDYALLLKREQRRRGLNSHH